MSMTVTGGVMAFAGQARVKYTIRVDGPESGTTISGDEEFWY